MTRQVLFLLLVLLVSNPSLAQDINKNLFYLSSSDYRDGKPADLTATFLYKTMSEMHIDVKSFIDPETNKKLTDFPVVWAFRYKGEDYVNASYRSDNPKHIVESAAGKKNKGGMFIKLTLKGRLCGYSFGVDDPIGPPVDVGAFGGGMMGALLALAAAWEESYWTKDKKHQRLIYCIDLLDTTAVDNQARVAVVNKAFLNQLAREAGDTKFKLLLENMKRDFTFEEIMAYLEKRNLQALQED